MAENEMCIHWEPLQDFTQEIFETAGLPPQDAAIEAEVLVYSLAPHFQKFYLEPQYAVIPLVRSALDFVDFHNPLHDHERLSVVLRFPFFGRWGTLSPRITNYDDQTDQII